jgi:hypothetical protein
MVETRNTRRTLLVGVLGLLGAECLHPSRSFAVADIGMRLAWHDHASKRGHRRCGFPDRSHDAHAHQNFSALATLTMLSGGKLLWPRRYSMTLSAIVRGGMRCLPPSFSTTLVDDVYVDFDVAEGGCELWRAGSGSRSYNAGASATTPLPSSLFSRCGPRG